MRPSTSSRLKPKVIWVRSLVPKEKKSASSAISPASSAARGVSIMVPIVTSSVPALACDRAAPLEGRGAGSAAAPPRAHSAPDPAPGQGQLLTADGEGDHDLDDGVAAVGHPLAGRLHQGPHL